MGGDRRGGLRERSGGDDRGVRRHKPVGSRRGPCARGRGPVAAGLHLMAAFPCGLPGRLAAQATTGLRRGEDPQRGDSAAVGASGRGGRALRRRAEDGLPGVRRHTPTLVLQRREVQGYCQHECSGFSKRRFFETFGLVDLDAASRSDVAELLERQLDDGAPSARDKPAGMPFPISSAVCAWYHKDGRAYLEKRGVSHDQARRHMLTYVPTCRRHRDEIRSDVHFVLLPAAYGHPDHQGGLHRPRRHRRVIPEG